MRMNWLDNIFRRLGLSIRAKLAVTFVGTFALLGVLLAAVLPSVIELSTRRLISASREAPTAQAIDEIREDLDVCTYLLQRQVEEIATGVRLAFGDGRAGDWLTAPNKDRAKLQAWLFETQKQLSLSVATVVDRESVTVARGSDPNSHGDYLCPNGSGLGPAARVVRACMHNAIEGREDAGIFVLDADVLAREKDVSGKTGRGGAGRDWSLADVARVRGREAGRGQGVSRGLVLAAMQPVRSSDGRVVGAVLAARLVNNDPRFFRRPANVLAETGVSFFLDSVCVASQPPRGRWSSWLGLRPPSQGELILAEGDMRIIRHQIGRTWFLSSMMMLRDPSGEIAGSLWVTRRYELRRLFAQLEALMRQARKHSWLLMVGEIVLTGILGLILASIAASRVVGPIRRLRNGARTIGAGDLDHHIEVNTGDELEELATAFNDMAGHLKDARRQDQLAMVGRMAGTITHDIRNPLTTIRGTVPLLADKDLSDEERAEFEEYLVDATDRIGDMITDLLDFSRGEERELSLTTEPLGAFVDHLEPLLQREFNGSGVELSLRVVEDPTVGIDHRTMERVVLNLASNARDAMDGNGQFTLEADSEDGWALLRAKDTGPGIPEEIRETLFEPFATHGKEHGTGLGLAICKQFVEAHGGQIEVDSPPGEGTTFTIRLPKAARG